MFLAGDVGATKILLEVGEIAGGRWRPVLARRLAVDDFPHMGAAVGAFLKEWETVKPARARIAAGAIGVAGPAQGNRVKMTHRAWVVDGDALARRFGIPRVTVVNDLAAAAHGIDLLAPKDLVTFQPGKPDPAAPRVVLGIGTGLGVAYLTGNRGQTPVSRGAENRGLSPVSVVAGEGGHVGFSPGSHEQAELWRALFASRGRVEAEDVASGMGLSNIYSFVCRGGDCPVGDPNRAEPAWIAAGAFERRDPQCLAALELFAECLGNIAGDHALAVMARGGVYLAGGVIAKIAPSLTLERFRSAFCAKGLFSSHLMRMPVRCVTNERLMILGAARIAQSR